MLPWIGLFGSRLDQIYKFYDFAWKRVECHKDILSNGKLLKGFIIDGTHEIASGIDRIHEPKL